MSHLKRPTMSDVAHLSGVSITTVSYVLNDRNDVSVGPETRRRVKESATKLGYRSNSMAMALRLGHTNIVLVVTDLRCTPRTETKTEAKPSLGAEVGSAVDITAGIAALGHPVAAHLFSSEDALLLTVQALQPLAIVVLCDLSDEVLQALYNGGTRHIIAGGDITEQAAACLEVVEQLIGHPHGQWREESA
jgi:DNA-binding LacI/PurR family transcriptional regulator